MKALFITEKPSVAREFATALNINAKNRDGYMEGDKAVITWCVGHLVTMSYPDQYDPALKKWDLETIPFIPDTFKYETIPGVQKQFDIVSSLLNREDIDTIYVCTDSGREGEYIYRLVDQQANVSKDKKKKRVWIDSQTEEEILRGIREAKDLSEYDNLSDSAYLRAKEDYLMGINFSRLLTLKYGNTLANYLHERYTVISVGRVMTCVQGMVVRREREIREFVKTPFYRVFSSMAIEGTGIESEWKAVEGSKFYQSPKLYKDNGFLQKEDAGAFIAGLPLFAAAVCRPGAVGGGDVKLMAAGGFFLGLSAVWDSLAFGMALAGGYCLYLMLFRNGRGQKIALGPFLSMGLMLGMFRSMGT